jgi:hypothetical protein
MVTVEITDRPKLNGGALFEEHCRTLNLFTDKRVLSAALLSQENGHKEGIK